MGSSTTKSARVGPTADSSSSLSQWAAEQHGDVKVGNIVIAVVVLILAAGIGVLIWAITDGPLKTWFDVTFGVAIGTSALGSVAKIVPW